MRRLEGLFEQTIILTPDKGRLVRGAGGSDSLKPSLIATGHLGVRRKMNKNFFIVW